MIVLEEVVHGALRLQVLACDCDEECETRFIVGMFEPRPLWLALSVVPEERVGEHVVQIRSDPEVLHTVAHGIALLGVERGRLDDRFYVFAQLQAWLAIPDWMARVPVERLWATRGWVFGSDLVRVRQGIEALDRYVPELEEGPVPAANMEMLIGRQMRLACRPRSSS